MVELRCTSEELKDGVRWEMFDDVGIAKPEAFDLFDVLTEHPLQPGTWHSWLSRKRLAPVGVDRRGRATYLLGDIRVLSIKWIEHKEECQPKPKPNTPPRARMWVPRTYLSGPDSPGWKGDKAGYHAIHRRMRTAFGRPSECAHCDDRTREAHEYHWALNWDRDPITKIEPSNGLHFSLDPSDYFRLCVTCHQRFDRQHVETLVSASLARHEHVMQDGLIHHA